MKVTTSKISFTIEMSVKQFKKLLQMEARYNDNPARGTLFITNEVCLKWFKGYDVSVEFDGMFGPFVFVDFHSFTTYTDALQAVDDLRRILQSKLN